MRDIRPTEAGWEVRRFFHSAVADAAAALPPSASITAADEAWASAAAATLADAVLSAVTADGNPRRRLPAKAEHREDLYYTTDATADTVHAAAASHPHACLPPGPADGVGVKVRDVGRSGRGGRLEVKLRRTTTSAAEGSVMELWEKYAGGTDMSGDREDGEVAGAQQPEPCTAEAIVAAVVAAVPTADAPAVAAVWAAAQAVVLHKYRVQVAVGGRRGDHSGSGDDDWFKVEATVLPRGWRSVVVEGGNAAGVAAAWSTVVDSGALAAVCGREGVSEGAAAAHYAAPTAATAAVLAALDAAAAVTDLPATAAATTGASGGITPPPPRWPLADAAPGTRPLPSPPPPPLPTTPAAAAAYRAARNGARAAVHAAAAAAATRELAAAVAAVHRQALAVGNGAAARSFAAAHGHRLGGGAVVRSARSLLTAGPGATWTVTVSELDGSGGRVGPDVVAFLGGAMGCGVTLDDRAGVLVVDVPLGGGAVAAAAAAAAVKGLGVPRYRAWGGQLPAGTGTPAPAVGRDGGGSSGGNGSGHPRRYDGDAGGESFALMERATGGGIGGGSGSGTSGGGQAMTDEATYIAPDVASLAIPAVVVVAAATTAMAMASVVVPVSAVVAVTSGAGGSGRRR
ncbi:hypothetical protein MMPV_004612 [Pyropia vietnamensis]